MSKLTLDQALAIFAAARAFVRTSAASRGRPVVLAAVDDGGHLVAVMREDGATFLRTEISFLCAGSGRRLT